MEPNFLRTVIATTADFGTTRDGRGTRLTYTYKALKETAAKYGIRLSSAKVVFSAMREMGFEEVKGGSGGARYAIDLHSLLLLTAGVMKEWTAFVKSGAAK